MLVENLLGSIPSAPEDTLAFHPRLQLVNPDFKFLEELDDPIDQGISDLELRPKAKLLIGFLTGIVEFNNFQEMADCVSGSREVFPAVKDALLTLIGGDLVKALFKLGNVLDTLHESVATCSQMGDDIAVLATWAHIL